MELSHLNTSHVILYHSQKDCSITRWLYLNTSHVILYPKFPEEWEFGLEFKYISCYSLSVFSYLTPHMFHDLNTSHVILYPFV